MLAQLAFNGELEAIKYILKKGADPNAESKTYHYRSGPALLYALQNNSSKPETKIDIVKTLIDAGADVNSVVNWIDNNKKAYKDNLMAFGLHEYKQTLEVYFGNGYVADATEKKFVRQQIKGLQGMLSVMNELGAQIPASYQTTYDELMNHDTEQSNKTTSPKEMYQAILKKLKVKNPTEDFIELAKEVCIEEMTDPEFVKTKEWGKLVKHMVDISPKYNDVAMEVYGEVPEDDGGGLIDSWGDSYSWYPELTEAVCCEIASENPKWEKLLLYVLDNTEKYCSGGWTYDILCEFNEEEWFIEHPDYKKLSPKVEYVMEHS
jgi:hypothetical protein